ncbi:MAG TPA: hypothetical protein ENI68_06880 [Gammaproteobacteria bacterium]|nr:hypothetical protein [Gammaproteobacteria bacterium]
MSLHPVIRIICFLVFVACLSRANAGQLLSGLGLLFGLYFYSPVDFLPRAYTMLLRLRWFFLSILVLYFWMAPDASQLNPPAYLFASLPSGMVAGLDRIFPLVLIVLAVNYLLASLNQNQLIAAIYWLTAPFAYAGLEREKMVLRLAMGLEAVGKLAKMPARIKDKNESQVRAGKNLYQRITGSLQYYYQYVLGCAEKDVGREYTFDCLTPPLFWQWTFPLGLYLLFLLVGKINWI